MNITRKSVKRTLILIGGDLLGTMMYAVGVHCFTSAHNIAPGGVTGIATIINYITGLPIGTLMLCINIPLLAIGFKFLGKKFTLRTLTAVLMLTVFMDYVVVRFPVYTGDRLLASIFGGVIMGAGLAVVFMSGSTTGGTDIITKILVRRFPYMQMGRLIFIMDVVIILSSIFAYKSIDSALYALIAMFATSKVIDAMLYGMDTGKLVMIVSQKNDEIASLIISQLDRGVTLLSGKGGYSKAPQDVLMCAVRNSEYYKLKQLAHDIDPKCFVIVTSTSEIRGEGFKPVKDEN